MNYYERCLKRIEDSTEVSHEYELSLTRTAYSTNCGLVVDRIFNFNTDSNYTVWFNGILVPIEDGDGSILFYQIQEKYNALFEDKKLKALEEL